MNIGISLDSTCDLSEELIKKYDFHIVPLSVTLGEQTYEDGKINTLDIFDYVSKTGTLPKTSAVNESAFVEFFTELRKTYDAVIHFDISSEMSSTYQNAVEAAQKVGNVYVVDSRSLSTGISLLAIYARALTQEYENPATIADMVRAKTDKVQASFVIERLDYLFKGGRCSALAYFGANLLKLRPQIIVEHGVMRPTHKYRGKMSKVVSDYCQNVLREFPDADKSVCFITHSHATPEMVEAAREIVTTAGFENIYETFAGCTVSSHCGKNTLGILFMNK